MTSTLEKRPNFTSMDDSLVKDYIHTYVKTHFKPRSRFMQKVPESLKDDTLHEIYIDLWQNRFNYDCSIADFTTYAYNRGRHVIKTMLTKSSANDRIRGRFKSLPSPEKSAESGYMSAESKDYFDFALSKMTKFQREVAEMRFFEEKSVAEIASLKECSQQKIYHTLSSLKKLGSTGNS